MAPKVGTSDGDLEELRTFLKARIEEHHQEWLNAKRALAKLPPRGVGAPKKSDEEKRNDLLPKARAARLVLDLLQEYLHKQKKSRKPRKNVPAEFMNEAIGIACAIHGVTRGAVRDLVNRHRVWHDEGEGENAFTLAGYIQRVRAFD